MSLLLAALARAKSIKAMGLSARTQDDCSRGEA
jgi:hypothetical protein